MVRSAWCCTTDGLMNTVRGLEKACLVRVTWMVACVITTHDSDNSDAGNLRSACPASRSSTKQVTRLSSRYTPRQSAVVRCSSEMKRRAAARFLIGHRQLNRLESNDDDDNRNHANDRLTRYSGHGAPARSFLCRGRDRVVYAAVNGYKELARSLCRCWRRRPSS